MERKERGRMERKEQSMDVTEDRSMVDPVYLVCEESAAMADALGGLNEGIAGLIEEMMDNPAIHPVFRCTLRVFCWVVHHFLYQASDPLFKPTSASAIAADSSQTR